MKDNQITLDKLTGLSEQDLADVFAQNPRAYMAVKGAVAEKHLELLLRSYKENGEIKDFKAASGDFDKDFYVTLKNEQVISLECKNIQVLNTNNKKIMPDYIKFLTRSGYLESDWLINAFRNMARRSVLVESNEPINSFDDLLALFLSEKAKLSNEFYKLLPQDYRESGVPRYEFSASLVEEADINKIEIDNFISQFSQNELTVDFQRTRNSTDKDGDNRKKRFYETNEIDVVGACLFSRTIKWQFIFGHSKHFDIHKKYKDRYANKLVINEGFWHKNLVDCF